ncbi:hypothetical protein SAMN05216304_11313 [Bosea sp. OK403]|nr:hypothetical protein SAMN05216304_11313 [Bosea sp. OK403]
MRLPSKRMHFSRQLYAVCGWRGLGLHPVSRRCAVACLADWNADAAGSYTKASWPQARAELLHLSYFNGARPLLSVDTTLRSRPRKRSTGRRQNRRMSTDLSPRADGNLKIAVTTNPYHRCVLPARTDNGMAHSTVKIDAVAFVERGRLVKFSVNLNASGKDEKKLLSFVSDPARKFAESPSGYFSAEWEETFSDKLRTQKLMLIGAARKHAPFSTTGDGTATERIRRSTVVEKLDNIEFKSTCDLLQDIEGWGHKPILDFRERGTGDPCRFARLFKSPALCEPHLLQFRSELYVARAGVGQQNRTVLLGRLSFKALAIGNYERRSARGRFPGPRLSGGAFYSIGHVGICRPYNSPFADGRFANADLPTPPVFTATPARN